MITIVQMSTDELLLKLKLTQNLKKIVNNMNKIFY